jgi:hypothetical protein
MVELRSFLSREPVAWIHDQPEVDCGKCPLAITNCQTQPVGIRPAFSSSLEHRTSNHVAHVKQCSNRHWLANSRFDQPEYPAEFARRWLTWRFPVEVPAPMAIRPENRTSANVGRVLEDPNTTQKWTLFKLT